MVATENQDVGAFRTQLLDDRRIVHGARLDAFVHDDLGGAVLLDRFLGEVSEALAVVALVVNDGDLLGLQLAGGKGGRQLALVVVGGDGAIEIGIFAALGQRRIGRRRADGDDLGALVDAHGGLGGAGADVADDDVDAFGDEFGRDVGGDFGLALIIDDHQFDLLAIDAALGVDVGHDHFGGLLGRQTVGGQIAGMRTGQTELDGVGGHGGCRESRRKQSGSSKFA